MTGSNLELEARINPFLPKLLFNRISYYSHGNKATDSWDVGIPEGVSSLETLPKGGGGSGCKVIAAEV